MFVSRGGKMEEQYRTDFIEWQVTHLVDYQNTQVHE